MDEPDGNHHSWRTIFTDFFHIRSHPEILSLFLFASIAAFVLAIAFLAPWFYDYHVSQPLQQSDQPNAGAEIVPQRPSHSRRFLWGAYYGFTTLTILAVLWIFPFIYAVRCHVRADVHRDPFGGHHHSSAPATPTAGHEGQSADNPEAAETQDRHSKRKKVGPERMSRDSSSSRIGLLSSQQPRQQGESSSTGASNRGKMAVGSSCGEVEMSELAERFKNGSISYRASGDSVAHQRGPRAGYATKDTWTNQTGISSETRAGDGLIGESSHNEWAECSFSFWRSVQDIKEDSGGSLSTRDMTIRNSILIQENQLRNDARERIGRQAGESYLGSASTSAQPRPAHTLSWDPAMFAADASSSGEESQ